MTAPSPLPSALPSPLPSSVPRSREDRLLLASLDGRARFHVFAHTPLEAAAADLREVATVAPPLTSARRAREPAARPVLRVDLLSEAAGHHLGVHEADSVVGWVGRPACELLIAAGGTDRAIARAAADEVRARIG